jgi:hypothetical protein
VGQYTFGPFHGLLGSAQPPAKFRLYRSLRLDDRGTMVHLPARATDLPLPPTVQITRPLIHSSAGKAVACQADHSPASSAEAKNVWSYLLHLPSLHSMTFSSKGSQLQLYGLLRIPAFRFISLPLIRSPFLISPPPFFTSLFHPL